MKEIRFNFEFRHPCGVALRPGCFCKEKPEAIKVVHNWTVTTIFASDVPDNAERDFRPHYGNDTFLFSTIMMGVAKVIKHLKETTPYATGKIGKLEDAYNAWQKWCHEEDLAALQELKANNSSL